MSKLARFLRLQPADRRLLLEASVWLVAARAALVCLPFRWIVGMAVRVPESRRLGDDAAATLVNRVRWAVRTSARNGIGPAVCFPQGIAAQRMLARRGVPSTLYYGVAKSPNGQIDAHVWVRAGTIPVVGCEIARRFTLLTTFPRERSETAASTGSIS